jgi:mRNA interferase MazF
VVVSLPGDFGKPRPALVIQDELFDEHPTVAVLPLSTTLRNAPLIRILVEPSPQNGLRERSQVMVDKPHTVRRSRIGDVIGRLDDGVMVEVKRALTVFLGIA